MARSLTARSGDRRRCAVSFGLAGWRTYISPEMAGLLVADLGLDLEDGVLAERVLDRLPDLLSFIQAVVVLLLVVRVEGAGPHALRVVVEEGERRLGLLLLPGLLLVLLQNVQSVFQVPQVLRLFIRVLLKLLQLSLCENVLGRSQEIRVLPDLGDPRVMSLPQVLLLVQSTFGRLRESRIKVRLRMHPRRLLLKDGVFVFHRVKHIQCSRLLSLQPFLLPLLDFARLVVYHYSVLPIAHT